MEQSVKLAECVGEAQPPGIAKHSASIEPDLAVSSGEDGSSGPEKSNGVARPPEIARHSAIAAVTTVASSVGVCEFRPPENAKYRATTAATVAVSPDFGKVRTPEIAKHSTCADLELAESSGGAGPCWSRAHGTTSAEVTAVVKYVGEARPPGFAKYSATQDVDVPWTRSLRC